MEYKINVDGMLEFYRNLDVIKLKYHIDDENGNEYAKWAKIESNYQFAELTKVDYGDVVSNLDLIYASEKDSDNIVELFDLVRRKIIHEYIHVEGLERLFSEKYIDFEWDMHLGMDHKNHKMKFYRDHFIHQIRNAYSMHVLLDEFGWLKLAKEVLLAKENSKVSSYVCKCIEQQKNQRYYGEKTLPKDTETRTWDDFYCENIIYMASYMAALFHDIGYPETANATNQRRILEYISNLYNAESSGYNYRRLNTLLQNSLLFRLVPFQEIQSRMSSDKADHGVFSSIIFLLNFYENGVIQGLDSYEKCAVELAALAIYNHTNKYRYAGKIKDGEYSKNLFVRNPISYILRICDDLQEWGRIYFELSNKSNLIICNHCKTPIVRKQAEDNSWFYQCNCGDIGEEKGIFRPVFDYLSNFPYRRIYNVTVCDEMTIEYGHNEMIFKLDYDLEKLLHIAYINPEYAKYRISELNAFKNHLDYQRELPKMKVEYFMTANPIMIKTEVIRRYWEKELSSKYLTRMNELLEVTKQLLEEGITTKKSFEAKWKLMYQLLENQLQTYMETEFINSIYLKAGKTRVIDSVKKSIELYVRLFLFQELYRQLSGIKEIDYTILKIKEKEIILDIPEVEENMNLLGLVKDCLAQYKTMFNSRKDYYKQFETSEYVYGCVKRFLSASKYIPVEVSGKAKIDGYTDLALISKLMKIVK